MSNQARLEELKARVKLLELKAKEVALAAQVAKEKGFPRPAIPGEAPAGPPTPEKPFLPQSGTELAESIETAGRSIAESATVGGSEFAFGGVNAVISSLIDAGENPKDIADFLSSAFNPEKLKAEYASDVARRRAVRAEHPAADITGQLYGGILPVGPAAWLAKGISSAAKGTTAAIGATKAAQAAKAIPGMEAAGALATGAGTAAAQGGIAYGLQKNIEEATGYAKPGELPSTGEVAGMAGKIGAGIAALPAIPVAAKLGLSAASRVPVDAIESYLKDYASIRPMINEALKPDGLSPQAQVSTKIGEAAEEITSAQAVAKEAAISAKADQRVAKSELNQAVALKKQQLQDELATAKAGAGQAKQAETAYYKEARLSKGFADDVVDGAERLKSRLGEESKKSYDILDKQKGTADFSGVLEEVQGAQANLLVNGQLLSAEEAKAFAVLQDWMEKIPSVMDDLGAVPYPRVKRIIQSIDRDIRKYSTPGSADFSELGRTKLMELRQILDSRLKAIPEYAEQMKTVKDLMDLQGEMSSFLGRENRIQGKLDRMWVPNNPDADLIVRLGQATDKNFAPELTDFAARKQVGASPQQLQAAIDALPETSELLKAQARVKRAKRIGAEQTLAPNEYTAWVKSQEDAIAAQAALQAADKAVKSIGPLSKEIGRFSAVRQLMTGKNPAYDDFLKALSQMSEQDFTREINAARTAEKFLERSGAASSKQTNTWAFGFGALGTMIFGDVKSGMASSGLGALLGNLSDAYGPRIAQKTLDAVISIEGMPTVNKLMRSMQGVPDSVRGQVVGSFVRAVSSSRQEMLDVAAADRDYIEGEIKSSQALTPMQKAKASAMVRQHGLIDSDTAKQIMLGTPASTPNPSKALGYNAFKAKKRPEVEAEK